MTTRAKGHNDIATYTPAARVREQMAICHCGAPLRFTTDGMGQVIEVCDRCTAAARRKPSNSEIQAMTTVATANTRATPPHAPLGKPAAAALAPPVAGKPCPHCGQKVRPQRMCKVCKKHPAPFGKQICTECKAPKSATRFCNACGVKFEYERISNGKKGGGVAWAYCERHRYGRKGKA